MKKKYGLILVLLFAAVKSDNNLLVSFLENLTFSNKVAFERFQTRDLLLIGEELLKKKC